MVEFADGSVKAHLGATDMRIPDPVRVLAPAPLGGTARRRSTSPRSAASTSASPTSRRSAACALALEAGRAGGTVPAALNAANEVAVAAFLAGECGFLDIEATVAAVLDATEPSRCDSVEQVEAVDARSRRLAAEWLRRVAG